MKKTYNKKIKYSAIYSLGMLAILGALLITTALKANTALGWYYVSSTPDTGVNSGMGYNDGVYGSRYSNSYGANQNTYSYQVPFYVQAPASAPAPIPTIYSNSVNSANQNTTNIATATKATAKVKTSAETLENPSNLAANVSYGSSSFMPSGIIGWVLLAILVLVVVILTRKIFGGEKDYNSTPMKHA